MLSCIAIKIEILSHLFQYIGENYKNMFFKFNNIYLTFEGMCKLCINPKFACIYIFPKH